MEDLPAIAEDFATLEEALACLEREKPRCMAILMTCATIDRHPPDYRVVEALFAELEDQLKNGFGVGTVARGQLVHYLARACRNRALDFVRREKKGLIKGYISLDEAGDLPLQKKDLPYTDKLDWSEICHFVERNCDEIDKKIFAKMTAAKIFKTHGRFFFSKDDAQRKLKRELEEYNLTKAEIKLRWDNILKKISKYFKN